MSFLGPRLAKLQQKITPSQAILLSAPSDIQYFTDFQFLVPAEREAYALLTKKQAYLIHNQFSPVVNHQKIINLPGCNLKKLLKHLDIVQQQHSFKTILVDESSLFVKEHQALQQKSSWQVRGLAKQLIWELRMSKDTSELAKIKKAVKISQQAWQQLEPQLTTGMTELAVKELLETQLKKLGSPQPAFPTIVAFGQHTALPHHQPTDQKLTSETAILIDFGASYQGYCSDMTRTIWFGTKPDPEFIKVEKLVKQAYQAAKQKLKAIAALKVKNLDQAARQVIKKAGYGDFFIHTTGHGLGLDIHEPPSINWKNQQPIKPGMVFTIEPGVYLAGKFGYRYENTVWT
ncbi:MAG: M24 family metallopeptidase [Candidatus Pacebacteria bacterium]|nr:M24 family metallopeptidase [Candidatus Paceibacterota bacterium]